jgi:hypothetical protein
MRKILTAALAALLLTGPLMAQTLEDMREASGNMNVNVGGLKQKAAADGTQVPFTVDKEALAATSAAEAAKSVQPKNPFEGLAKAISALLKLLFSPNGDIEIAGPPGEVPQVEGTLQDDQAEETYDAAATYTPLQEADYAPAAQPRQAQGQRQFMDFLHPGTQAPDVTAEPGRADGSGAVPADLKSKALAFFNANSGRITNKRYIGIVDFAAHSSRARFFILDTQTGQARAIHVAHGRGSDPDGDGYATKFSNTPDSKASSLGFYLTGALYSGSHGKSMRLIGLSSTNSNVLARAVVVHESAYVREANVTQGRSFGCLAVATSEIRGVLASLNGGALIYAGLSNSEF